jgi:23S rRNA (cytidine1920-2'-O)/16S rRNA (cytidine1409-2'-O)-methyltransferase
VTRTRLDGLLVERGLYPTRARAAAAVMAGRVRLGAGGDQGRKPGQLVPPDVELEVDDSRAFASRGGIKLQNALEALTLDPTGRLCLDVGASTGGFTDCLLGRGALAVVALDVGYGQLDWRLRQDHRVTVLDRTNARALTPEALPFRPDLVTVDVSFISLVTVLPAVLGCTAQRFDCLALVKPQFEVGRGRVGKGGVVRSAEHRRAALTSVAGAVAEAGWSVHGFASSGLPGPAGNLETFVWIAEAGRAGTAVDLEAAAREVEP